MKEYHIAGRLYKTLPGKDFALNVLVIIDTSQGSVKINMHSGNCLSAVNTSEYKSYLKIMGIEK